MASISSRGKRAILALVWLLVGAFFNLVLQVWIDKVPTDYNPTLVLWDLGFVIIPNDLPKWGADVALIALFVVAILRLTFVPYPNGMSPLEVWIRFGWVWGMLYYLRGCTVGLTRFPRLLPYGPLPEGYDGLFGGLWGILSGATPTQADFMFSGHTATMTLLGLFVSYYGFRRFFSHIYWLLVFVGYWAIIASRIHYTADVLVAIIVTFLVFSLFHAFADPEWMTAWRAVLTIRMDKDEKIVLPMTIYEGGSSGRYWEVYAPQEDEDGLNATSDKKRAYESNKLHVLHVGRYSNEERRGVYYYFMWLLTG